MSAELQRLAEQGRNSADGNQPDQCSEGRSVVNAKETLGASSTRNILAEIVANKRLELAQRRVPLEALRRPEAFGPVRDFRAALAKPGRRFIMECKRASPSQGVIRRQFTLAEIGKSYDGIADVISVLTDETYFGGHLDHLAEVRALTSAPILRKDFTLEPYQVREAWAHGADAILLMLSVLDDAGYRACAAEAKRLGLGILTEVHDAGELARAIALNAEIIGINNRDLRTLQIDLALTEHLAPQIPAGRLVVSESGIADHADVRRLGCHAKAFLVGSSLMKAAQVDLAARELAFGAVKICGLTRPEDVLAAYQLGAVYGGLIFAPESPRRISALRAKALQHIAPLRFVGVFSRNDIDEIVATARELNLYAVQLHGEFSETDIVTVKSLLPGVEVWQVQRLGAADPGALSSLDARATAADRILFDSSIGGALGGNGTAFDWTMLQALNPRQRYVLAGGLNPDNIGAAAALGCGVLDVNSGVESAPGVKDETKLRALFQALRQ